MPTKSAALVLALQMALASTAQAQHHGHHGHHAPEEAKSSSQSDPHAGHEPPKQAAADGHHDHNQHDHATMQHADHAAMGHATPAGQPREPIPPVTDADRAAAFPDIGHSMEHASSFNTFLLFDRLEATRGDGIDGQAWEVTGWAGGDINRLWLRSEGEREGGRTESADIELLYGRSISPWWDVVTGIRHETRPGPSRTAAAFGIQGLAPYMFEISATAYLAESGHSRLALEAEYDVLLTNRLILQPVVEVEFNGKDDPTREVGSGLSRTEFGMRLRYEISRRFAPYIGVVRERAWGNTADIRRSHAESTNDTRAVAGIRIWF
ncbi:copper resistance protein B [Lysobacter alkalisoli]|uniref:Copper resistance protein B n=2 Tax=Marilutibacter alkalisoli TaxID=2591633 RepID=A0A514BWM7_9GAMM|nr:copper resistance protein B [Lysobacter alkalisoli]